MDPGGYNLYLENILPFSNKQNNILYFYGPE